MKDTKQAEPMRALVTVNLDEEHDGIVAGLERLSPLLARFGAEIDLLYVMQPMARVHLDPRNPELGPLLDAADERMQVETTSRLESLLQQVPASLRGRAEVIRAHDVALAISTHAASHDLVVLVTHARRGLQRVWLGSVAELVVRTSPVPILVVGKTPTADGHGGILVAVDLLDDNSGTLLERVADLAARMQAKVDLLTVVSPMVATLPAWLPFATFGSEGLAVDLDAIKQRLAARAAPIDAAFLGEVRVDLGDPAAVIASTARDYDLLILGTHGRTGVNHVVLGSVAERVVRWSPVPTLIVPPPR